jgi:glycosyltransferase involved in cell wall biosynthesis
MRLLLLAYYFPPIGGAGAQRNTKLARYLPERGFEIDVITGPLSDGHRWAPQDETMIAEIHESVRVHRIPGPEPSWSSGWRRRTERWLRRPWPWQGWWADQTVRLALERARDVDLVYCSLAPFAVAPAAIEISRQLDRPLVLDLEDPWALDEMLIFETGLHRRLELRTMERVLRTAAGIVMNTPESAARVLETFPRLRSTPVTSIVNGYDSADFDGPPPPRTDDAFRIVHTGTLHSVEQDRHPRLRRFVGGGTEAHIASRSLIYLLRAVDELLGERPDLADRIEVHLAGRLTDADRREIGDSHLVHEHGFLPHRETIGLIRSADLLFLPMHDVPAGSRAAIVPCKSYEYLASKRPILAAVPDGDLRDMLADSGTARLARPTDVAELKTGIAEAIDAAAAGLGSPGGNDALLARIERQSLTSCVVEFLDVIHTSNGNADLLLAS